uniref:Phosphatidylinositol-3-phosphatase n=1 Tax=Syphacia muris TaxID=451379 RepID=A0A0N5A906_9BILA
YFVYIKDVVEIELPVPKICGEIVESSVEIDGGELYLTNYRIVVTEGRKHGIACIPIVGVESVEARDTCGLQITCKYGRIYKLVEITLLNNESTCEWYKRLSQKTVTSRSIGDIFAWQFAKIAKARADWLNAAEGVVDSSAKNEFKRLDYPDDKWRVSTANHGFRICDSYPEELVVPLAVSDDDLRLCAEARTLSRFPVAVWYYKKKETVLMRSSQPRVGIFSYRYEHDEQLMECARVTPSNSQNTTLLIIDARSYTAALGNRAKGGGVELPDYYKETEVEYMSLPNIHNIRYAFHQLRSVLENKYDLQFHMSLQSTNWFPYLYSLMESAYRCVRALCDEGRSVLVHCSDGWDRTTQITTLAKIIADPYYRTFKGFRELIQRDWIDFGHKFSDRLGLLNLNPNEVSPVFLQWLDCVYQLHHQNINAFQFSISFLVLFIHFKTQLALHAYSGLFGTFLWNSLFDRKKYQHEVEAETLSAWSYFCESNPEYINIMYSNQASRGRLRRLNGLVDLVLWKELYMCTRIEDIINEPDTKEAGSMYGDSLRNSFYRSHSEQSLTNIDGLMHNSVVITSPVFVLQTSEVDDEDIFGVVEDQKFPSCSYDSESQFSKLVDVSGLSKVDDQMEQIRQLMQKTLKDKESEMLREFERTQLQQERTTEIDNPVLATTSAGPADNKNRCSSMVCNIKYNGLSDRKGQSVGSLLLLTMT